VDNRIRKNEICIVGLPSCDYVFASSPSCFIAYGFNQSTLEMEVLRAILKERRIESHEAGGSFAPAQQVFCQKICSRIIQAQFCIVLLNNDTVGNAHQPNANVNMEYGLMLGFNKYVIPFQLDDHRLPFNVSGLDTIKYSTTSFRSKAEAAIDQAISETNRPHEQIEINPDIGAYLLLNGWLVVQIDNPVDKAVYQMGAAVGFNLCHDFSGLRYMYFGNFAKLPPQAIAWRIRKLADIIDKRLGGMEARVQAGIMSEQQKHLYQQMRAELELWALVRSKDDSDAVLKLVEGCALVPKIFTITDVDREVSESEAY
jgi:hypothetical protein